MIFAAKVVDCPEHIFFNDSSTFE